MQRKLLKRMGSIMRVIGRSVVRPVIVFTWCFASSTYAAPIVLRTAAVIMGEPNFSIDGKYQELDEGYDSRPELMPGAGMLIPVDDIVDQLGGQVSVDAAGRRASYRLNGVSVELAAGSARAIVNGQARQLPTPAQWRGTHLWVAAPAFFGWFGAVTAWNPARQRFTDSFLLPAAGPVDGVAKGCAVQAQNMNQQAPRFYASAAGRKVAEVVLAYQNADGGWPKVERDTDMSVTIDPAYFAGMKRKSTIDNDATTAQIIFLAKVAGASGNVRYRAGFERGLDYLFAAQLANGGWQQFWPDPIGYKRHITFNDDAMVRVLALLAGIRDGAPDYAFVDAARRDRAAQAVRKGLRLILDTQLVVGGRKSAWCAQYDETTLAPAAGRTFELASVSGSESVGVIRFLMAQERPSAAIVDAIQGAVAWFDAHRITGMRRVRRPDSSLEFGFDSVMVSDAAAPPLWARFYALDTGLPLFAGRDGARYGSLAEVPYERRVHYNWFSEAPGVLIANDYPAWRKKWNLPDVLAH